MKKCQKNDECPSCQAVHFCPMAVVSLFKNTLHNSLNYSRTSNAMIHDAKKANTWGSTLQTSVFFTQAHLRQDSLHKQGNFKVPVKIRKIHKYTNTDVQRKKTGGWMRPCHQSCPPLSPSWCLSPRPLSSHAVAPLLIHQHHSMPWPPTTFSPDFSYSLFIFLSIFFCVQIQCFGTLGVSALHCLNFCVPVQYFHVFCVLA